jgi:hypothetical protein
MESEVHKVLKRLIRKRRTRRKVKLPTEFLFLQVFKVALII